MPQTIKNFYPEAYMVLDANKIDFATVVTRDALVSALGTNWIELQGTENGAEQKESKGKDVELTTGKKVVTSMTVSGTLNFLNVDPDNYSALRANFHKKKCAILLWESQSANTGFGTQISGVYPKIFKGGKNGDLLRVKIDYSFESSSNAVETKQFTNT